MNKSRLFRVSISFDVFPDNDVLYQEMELDDDELESYLKNCFHDDIVQAVKMNDLYELIDVEVFDNE